MIEKENNRTIGGFARQSLFFSLSLTCDLKLIEKRILVHCTKSVEISFQISNVKEKVRIEFFFYKI